MEEPQCPICLENLEGDVAALNCGHKFHEDCVEILKKFSCNCPCCRAKFCDRGVESTGDMPENFLLFFQALVAVGLAERLMIELNIL